MNFNTILNQIHTVLEPLKTAGTIHRLEKSHRLFIKEETKEGYKQKKNVVGKLDCPAVDLRSGEGKVIKHYEGSFESRKMVLVNVIFYDLEDNVDIEEEMNSVCMNIVDAIMADPTLNCTAIDIKYEGEITSEGYFHPWEIYNIYFSVLWERDYGEAI